MGLKLPLVVLFWNLILHASLVTTDDPVTPACSTYPVGDIRNCPTIQLMDSTKPLLQTDVLPGLGFDNLRNLDLGRVFNYNFSKCQISSNGLYLLPNDISLVPVQHSQVDYTAEVFDKLSQWKSETSHSLNANTKISYAKINAKFSMDYQKTKSKMTSEKSRSTRIGLRYNLYSVDINPNAQLNPAFKSRIFEIAANIQNKNTKLAHYLAELLVRDYGTHVVTSIDAGAVLSQTTFLEDQSSTNSESSHLGLSASASSSFGRLFSIKVKYKYNSNDTQTDTFEKKSTSSFTTTHGGPPFRLGNFSLSNWENGLLDHLVPIDRRGEPLYFAITSVNVPELPAITRVQVSEYIYKAIARYYKINTHKGCTDVSSKNFNFHANIDDKSCEPEQQVYTFGGIYQTCEDTDDYPVCKEKSALQKNPLTSGYSCPDEYTAILLHSGTLTVNAKIDITTSYRNFWGKIKHKTHTVFEDKSATYEAYWCALPPNSTKSTGLLFGGVYTSTKMNVLTGKQSCPQFYFPLHFGEDMEVCVSSDVQGSTENLKFGGFYSCTVGNPMAATAKQYSDKVYPKLCPMHYNQLMITVDQDCIVNYCTDVRQVLELEPQPPVLPPFNRKVDFSSNTSNVLVLTDSDGSTWVKMSNGEWEKAVEPDDITTGIQLMKVMTFNISDDDDDDDDTTPVPVRNSMAKKKQYHYSSSELAGIIIGTAVGTLSVVLFVWAIGIGVKKIRQRKRSFRTSTDEELPIVSVQ